MRDFNQLLTVGKNPNTRIDVTNIPEFCIEDYDLFDDKDRRNYINDVKKDVRNSYEYHVMVGYLKENMDMRRCSFLHNIANYGNGCKVKIELHHHPFTLEDIVSIVLNKRIAYNESTQIEFTGKEVMYLHYNLMIGLIPLSQTVHELNHNNYVFIPNEKVYGNYKKFVNLYYNHIDPELLDKFDRLEEVSDAQNIAHYTVLGENRIYLTAEDEYKTPDLSGLQKTLQQRLNDLRKEDEATVQPPLMNPFIHV